MNKYGYIILRANGDMELIESRKSTFELEELQSVVGGYIQIVQGRVSNMLLVLDDEGKLKGKPINRRATALYAPEYDCIVGDVVVGTNFSEESDEPDVYKLPLLMAKRFFAVIKGF